MDEKPGKTTRFQFGLGSLFVVMAGVGFLSLASQSEVFWLLIAIAVFGLVVAIPFLLFYRLGVLAEPPPTKPLSPATQL